MSIIATSLPVFSIQAVGHDDLPSLTFQDSAESITIPGADPTLIGTCSTICPSPLPFEILILITPTSPAIASAGGVTYTDIIPV